MHSAKNRNVTMQILSCGYQADIFLFKQIDSQVWDSGNVILFKTCKDMAEMLYLWLIMWFMIKNAGQITTQLSCQKKWFEMCVVCLDDILLLVAIMLYLIDLSHSYTKQK